MVLKSWLSKLYASGIAIYFMLLSSWLTFLKYSLAGFEPFSGCHTEDLLKLEWKLFDSCMSLTMCTGKLQELDSRKAHKGLEPEQSNHRPIVFEPSISTCAQAPCNAFLGLAIPCLGLKSFLLSLGFLFLGDEISPFLSAAETFASKQRRPACVTASNIATTAQTAKDSTGRLPSLLGDNSRLSFAFGFAGNFGLRCIGFGSSCCWSLHDTFTFCLRLGRQFGIGLFFKFSKTFWCRVSILLLFVLSKHCRFILGNFSCFASHVKRSCRTCSRCLCNLGMLWVQ